MSGPVCAIYCRLSREDAGRQGDESESIQNQRLMLTEYAAAQGWEIGGVFCDEDYSGADRDRPAFNRMLGQAAEGRFDIILVKTLSRFTRELETLERYIHGRFEEWGVRFVALVDHLDTGLKGNKKARQINGLVNEWYLEDLSENIRSVLASKRKDGQYVGGFPLYGYRKADGDRNRLTVDLEAAAVVREIYALYIGGLGKTQIAKALNDRGVPNPARYKQNKGWGSQAGEPGLWHRNTVGRILAERMYTGDLVQGRRKKASYKSKRMLNVPPEEWDIVEGAHEAIINKATFRRVQELRRERTRTGGEGGEAHLLAGKVRCLDCGSAMVKTSVSYRGKVHAYLRCRLYSTDKKRCSSHSIRLDRLEAAVAGRIREELGRLDPDRLASLLRGQSRSSQEESWIAEEENRLIQALARLQSGLGELYLDKAAGLISAEQYAAFQRDFTRRGEQLERERAALSARRRESGPPEDAHQALASLMAGEPPRGLVRLLIDRIEVGEREGGRQVLRLHWQY